MCAYVLIKPSKDYIKEIEDFKKEIFNFDSKYKFDGCSGLQHFDDINEWIEKLEAYSSAETCPKDKVPSTLYLFVRDEDDKIVGMIDVRHHINHPVLSTIGGHIGYSVRPSERGKGIGTEMLKAALVKCKEFGNNKVLITCYKDNAASERVIIKNGGVFEKDIEQDGGFYKRYWIDLK